MAEGSEISWCDSTYNPWIGCTKVSPGCDHCYAERDFDLRKGIAKWGPGNPRHRTKTTGPRKWERHASDFFAAEGRKRRVFCASLADVFDNEVPNEWRDDLWTLIRETPNLDWLIVTKRIGNAAKMLPSDWGEGYPNVMLLITVVNQAEADRDILKLLATPALRRGLSIEPMLGPIDLSDPLAVEKIMLSGRPHWTEKSYCTTKLDWVIVGGESGPRARPMHPDWARSLRDQCAAAGVPFHFKQWGEWVAMIDRDRDDPDWRNPYSQIINNMTVRVLNLEGGWGFHGERVHIMRRDGKRKAGRLLDGKAHHGLPT